MWPRFSLFLFILVLFSSCDTHQSIASNIEEREANEIVVFLASKNIEALKIQMPATTTGGGGPQIIFYSISVPSDQATNAMAVLNRYGLPRRPGTNLLTIFAKSGLMSSDREETIRYQAGLAEELKNTILKIDGIIDADVQISFPPTETLPGVTPPKTTAAVYIKHQGILEDPNSHLEVKIKRLLAGSVNGLNFNDVSVIADRSRLTDIQLPPEGEMISSKNLQQTYVSIWGLILAKNSLTRFRVLFFALILFALLSAGAVGWMAYKFYPLLRQKKPETDIENS